MTGKEIQEHLPVEAAPCGLPYLARLKRRQMRGSIPGTSREELELGGKRGSGAQHASDLAVAKTDPGMAVPRLAGAEDETKNEFSELAEWMQKWPCEGSAIGPEKSPQQKGFRDKPCRIVLNLLVTDVGQSDSRYLISGLTVQSDMMLPGAIITAGEQRAPDIVMRAGSVPSRLEPPLQPAKHGRRRTDSFSCAWLESAGS
jgi:hypothetical protein